MRFTVIAVATFRLAFTILLCAFSVARADAIDDYVQSEMAKRRIPGLCLAVIRNDRVVKETAYGVASVELATPASVETSYPLASVTKIFTAVTIMRLVEEGRISLDESITKVLPELPPKWSPVTIRHCLAHTSGLPDAVIDGINTTTVAPDRESLFGALSKMPVQVPGERSVYNQTEYVLLGMIIEKTTGTRYEEYLESRWFRPLGLADLSFGDAWAIIPRRTDFYTALDVTPDHSKFLVRGGQPVFLHDRILRYESKSFPDYLAPAGGLNGTIRDLVKWETALSDGKVLKPSTFREMTTPYKLRDGKSGDFGLGFVTGKIGPYATVSYGGGAAAWRLSIPEKKLTVIVLTNLQGSAPETLAKGIAALYEPRISTASGH
jgi:CubicO group peptidase (beta-lactamase class C family)